RATRRAPPCAGAPGRRSRTHGIRSPASASCRADGRRRTTHAAWPEGCAGRRAGDGRGHGGNRGRVCTVLVVRSRSGERGSAGSAARGADRADPAGARRSDGVAASGGGACTGAAGGPAARFGPGPARAPVVSRDGSIEFRAADFRWPESAAPVLRDVDLHIAPGTHVAVVGRSGAGKSTLVAALAGFLSAEHGTAIVPG